MPTVYVHLLDEGTPVWRPVDAVARAEDVYELAPSVLPDLDDEHWEFAPGDWVRCVPRVFTDSGATELVAVERVALNGRTHG
jgi:hypothetical protein